MSSFRTPYAFDEQKDGYFVYKDSLSPPPPQPPIPIPSNPDNAQQVVPSPQSSSFSKISPVLLLVIILLAVIFFLAGLVHLLLRFLIKRPSSSPIFQSNRFPENSHSHALQRQLRQLFRLHDSGLDQAIIDALPVFYYKDIVGLKQPFDCAVCLCEFSGQDELRLLPACSHAFHICCIDTWLLSNSTCPLCRRTLLISDLFVENPMLNFDDHVETPRELPSEGENWHSGNRVFSVRLGKFKCSNNNGVESEGEKLGETSRCNLDARRCYSMGTFRYVVGESNLQVTLCHEGGGGTDAKLSKESGHSGKLAVSGDLEGKKISRRHKGESFSVSKIWLWSKNSRFPTCSDTNIQLPTSSAPARNPTQSAQMV